MAEIVELQAFEEKRPKQNSSEGPGEVVIFPGVRIDRDKISLADRLSRPKGLRSTSTTHHCRADRDE